MNLQSFEGDILLVETPDGGDFVLLDGVIVADNNYSTAVYLSLFGGNKDDSGAVKTNKTWWGNTLKRTEKNEKLISRFQNIIRARPLTVKNIKDAETAATLDLSWMVEEGLADKIEAIGSTKGRNRFNIEIHLIKSGESIFNYNFDTIWGSE
jgi:phage gp46-like protein